MVWVALVVGATSDSTVADLVRIPRVLLSLVSRAVSGLGRQLLRLEERFRKGGLRYQVRWRKRHELFVFALGIQTIDNTGG